MPLSRKQKTLFWSLAGLFLAGIIACLVVPIEYGRQRWETVRRDLKARGERLFAKDFPQTTVAAAENYFEMPLFKDKALNLKLDKLSKMTDDLRKERDIASSEVEHQVGQSWNLAAQSKGLNPGATEEEKRQETLRWLGSKLEPLEEMRTELIRGGQRPLSSTGYNLEKGYLPVAGRDIPMISIARYLRLHVTLALEQKDSKAAMADIECMVRAAQAYASELSGMHLAVARAVWHLMLLSIRQGMEIWSDEELVQLQKILAQNPVGKKRFAETLRLERATSNSIIQEAMAKGDPQKIMSGAGVDGAFWFFRLYLPLPWANFNLAVQSLIDLVESESATAEDYDALKSIRTSRTEIERFSNFLGDLSVPMWAELGRKTIRCSDETLLMQVAIALEIFRRKNGQYPERLDQLIPTCLEKIAAPTLPGQKIHYRRSTRGGYRIWTPGWNGTDEDGIPESNKGRDGDWILHAGEQEP